MPDLPPLGHLALSVTDLAVSEPFYRSVFGTDAVATLDDGPFTRRLFPLGGGQHLGLTQHDGPPSAERFDPRRPGLDHIGLACTDRHELEAWAAHLDEVGVAHSGIVDADYGSVLSFKDPDGTALELFAAT